MVLRSIAKHPELNGVPAILYDPVRSNGDVNETVKDEVRWLIELCKNPGFGLERRSVTKEKVVGYLKCIGRLCIQESELRQSKKKITNKQ